MEDLSNTSPFFIHHVHVPIILRSFVFKNQDINAWLAGGNAKISLPLSERAQLAQRLQSPNEVERVLDVEPSPTGGFAGRECGGESANRW